MDEFVLNPRRSPRIPARCRASLGYRGATWEGETEDLGPSGCQIISPRPIAEGGKVQLSISSPRVPGSLEIMGRVAWITGTSPHRLGMAFVAGSGGDPEDWFHRFLEGDPKLAAAIRRVPERLPVSAWLFLAEPPSLIIDFAAEELALIRAVGNGATLSEVRVRLGREWDSTRRAVFALLTRRVVTLNTSGAVPFQRWKQVLDSAEAALAADNLGRPGLAELRFDAPLPQGRPAPAPVPRPAPAAARPDPPPPPRAVRPAPAAPASARRAEVPGLGIAGAEALMERDILPGSLDDEETISLATADETAVAPAAAPSPASRPGGARPARAQELFDRARAEHAAGDVHAAIQHLREALSAAPHDPEIGALLGQLAFKDRRT